MNDVFAKTGDAAKGTGKATADAARRRESLLRGFDGAPQAIDNGSLKPSDVGLLS